MSNQHSDAIKHQTIKGSVQIRPWLHYLTKTSNRILLAPFFRLQTNGKENLPKTSAFILLPKHQRWEDIPFLAIGTPRRLYYVAKYELFNNAISDWFFKSVGGIPLNRQDPLKTRRYLRDMNNLLERGEGVVVFPEGTYYRDKMGAGNVGIVRFILKRFSVPFIPVGINYTRKSLFTAVRINFGKPLHEDPGTNPNEFLNRLMQEIAKLSGFDD
ncbi:lysophospholipid acyltransferase family protein [Thermodesulfobacteriota bacterium]